MKTICEHNGVIIMSQEGTALEAMQNNAAQYVGASARVVSDAEFSELMSAKLESEAATAAAKAEKRINKVFPEMNAEQRAFLASLARNL